MHNVQATNKQLSTSSKSTSFPNHRAMSGTIAFDNSLSLPIIAVKFSKHLEFQSLLDSGCTRSLVTSNCLNKLKQAKLVNSKSEQKFKAELTAVNGETITVRKKVRLHFKIDKYSWYHEFWVCSKLPFEVILGFDMMKRTKLNMDVGKGIIKFQFATDNEILVDNVQNSCYHVTDSSSESQTQRQVSDASTVVESDLLSELIAQYPDVITDKIGLAKVQPYEILLSDPTPVRKSPYPLSPDKLLVMKNVLKDLVDNKVITKSFSSWSSPAFLQEKPDKKSHRLLVNYRECNKHIIFDSHPLPTIDNAFQFLSNSCFFSTVDLKSAYYQLPISQASRNVTAFCVPTGCYEFTRVPQGICIGSQALSRAMNEVLGDYKFDFVYNFLDDLIIFSQDYETHVKHIKLVLDRLRQYGFTVNPNKIVLAKNSVNYLGHTISNGKLSINSDRTDVIKNFPTPKNLKQVLRFTGLCAFYSRFIKNFSLIAAPLYALKAKDTPFKWEEQHKNAFDSLKTALTTFPTLALPDPEAQYVVTCDASDSGIGAVLQIKKDNLLLPVHYASKKLTDAERRYPTYKKEFLACLFAVEKFKPYLSKKFILQTDNIAVTYIMNSQKQLGQLARWAIRLAEFDFTIEHIRGSLNNVSDCLSRMFECTDEDSSNVSENTQITDTCFVLQFFPEVFQDLPQNQRADNNLNDIIKRLETGTLVNNYKIRKNVLYFQKTESSKPKIVVPESMQNLIVKYFHEMPMFSHAGIAKTINRVQKDFVWKNMHSFIRNFVKSCNLCQMSKPALNQKIGLMHSRPALECNQVLYCDFVGPLTRTSQGNTSIFVVMDSFSKFVFLQPVRKQTAGAAIKILKNFVFSHHGFCNTLVSDNASQFKSKEMYSFLFGLGIKHVTTSAYRPQSNNSERVNRNLVTALRIYSHSNHKMWDTHLPYLMLSFNTCKHDSTGVTPASVYLGRELKHPLQLHWDIQTDMLPLDKESRMKEVVRHLKEAHAKTKVKYDKDRVISKFKVGDKVLYKAHPQSSKVKKINAKLKLRWLGPFIVQDILSPVNVRITQEDDPGHIRVVHVSQLKMYNVR